MGFITKVQTHGVLLPPLNPLTLAISQDASFVGRGYAGKGDHLKELIKEAVLHPGFALIDILQPCEYDSANKPAAFQKAQEWEDKIPLGIIYKKERPAFEHQQPVLKKGTLISQAVDPRKLNAVLSEFI
jgi:2-oxoglutarate ferredoxin oxidoreductase subunit beta